MCMNYAKRKVRETVGAVKIRVGVRHFFLILYSSLKNELFCIISEYDKLDLKIIVARGETSKHYRIYGNGRRKSDCFHRVRVCR